MGIYPGGKVRCMMKKIIISGIVLCLLLSGCKMPKQEERKTNLVLAAFEQNAELDKQVALFNQENEAYHIEVRQYNRYEDGDGIQRLQREIVSGEGPDIINFGSEYMLSDIVGQYTEDLNPYFTEMSEEENLEFWQNLIQAFSYKEKLYALPTAFTLQTYVARTETVGERESWSIEELMQCYEENKKGKDFMLYPGETKKDVFGTLLTGSIDNYVDWEKGTCRFDSEEFRQILEFANQFPAALTITEDCSPMEIFQNGKALLYPLLLRTFYDTSAAEIIMGEPVTYVGYPVSEKTASGTVIKASSDVWAISSTSKNKEAAWEFISRFYRIPYQEEIKEGLPVNKSAFEKMCKEAMQTEYEEKNGESVRIEKARVSFEGEQSIPIYQISEAQADSLKKVVGGAAVFSGYDSGLHTILLEESEAYFAGDKTLDETVEIMQKRAVLYMNEKIK